MLSQFCHGERLENEKVLPGGGKLLILFHAFSWKHAAPHSSFIQNAEYIILIDLWKNALLVNEFKCRHGMFPVKSREFVAQRQAIFH